MKTFKLKQGQDKENSIDKVEIEIETTEQVTRTVSVTLEQVDQEIRNIDERIAMLRAEKAGKEADRNLIEEEVKKLKVIN